MRTLVGIISQLATMNVKRTVARTGRNGIFLGIAGILFLTTYLFGLIALALWIARTRDPIVAALAIAAGALVLGLIVLTVMAIINRVEERRSRERRVALESMVVAGISMIRSQPLLMSAITAAFLASSLFKSKSYRD